MNFISLIYFVNVADHGNISAASRSLHVAQPALTRHIRRLEEDLQYRLFDRASDGVRLTGEGRRLYERARLLVTDYEQLARDFSPARSDISGKAVIGLPKPCSNLLSNIILRDAEENLPDLDLRVIEEYRSGFKGEWCDWLKNGEMDLYLAYQDPQEAGIRAEVLGIEKLVLVAGGGMDLFRGHRDLGRFLDSHRILVPHFHPYYRVFLEKSLTGAGYAADFDDSCESWDELIGRVRRSGDPAFLPYSLVMDPLEYGEMIACPWANSQLTRPVYCLTRAYAATPAVRQARSCLLSACRTLMDQGIWQPAA